MNVHTTVRLVEMPGIRLELSYQQETVSDKLAHLGVDQQAERLTLGTKTLITV